MNSHIWALGQHNDRILDNAPGSAALRWGFKIKTSTEPVTICDRIAFLDSLFRVIDSMF